MNRLSILDNNRYFSLNSITLILLVVMKSKDFQNLVLSKYQNGDGPTKIFRDLNGSVSLWTIERWCKAVRDTGSINLSSPPGRQRTIRTKGAIQKIKHRLERRKPVSSRKTARQLGISRTNVRRILRNDLGLRVYKIQNEPLLSNEHKEKRVKFVNWIRTNFRKENTMKILFSDEKMFDIDGIYNSQMIEYGRLIVQLPIPKVVSGKNESFRKRLWFGSEFVLKVYPPPFSDFRG